MKKISDIINFLSQNAVFSFSPNQRLFSTDQTQIHHISQDHRYCSNSSIFIALKGGSFDGHHYVKQVLDQKTPLVIVENLECLSLDLVNLNVIEVKNIRESLGALSSWFYDYPSKAMPVYAATGTNGKSTIAHLIAQLMTLLSQKVGVLGTIGNGVYPNLVDAKLTTLDVVSLQKTLAVFVENSVQGVSMEASSHAIDQGRIDALEIDTAIFSNLDVDHLDYHGTMDQYFEAKSCLFTRSEVKKCVINIDDKYGQKLYQNLRVNNQNHAELFTFSLLDKTADCFINIHDVLSNGFEVTIHWQQRQKVRFIVPVLGQYNVSNIAASVAALLSNGYDLQIVCEALLHIKGVKGRLEPIIQPNRALVVIDFAHTADALGKALQALKPQLNGKLYCVFGCGGGREVSKRRLMAQAAQEYADFCIVTEDNSRTESTQQIMSDITNGFDQEFDQYCVIESRQEAIHYALQHAVEGDIVLLAGKGHETYLDKNNQKIAFDEREAVQKFWNQHG